MTQSLAHPPRPRDESFRFVVPARLEYRDAARAFLAYVCEQLSKKSELPEDVGHRVISAFVEAFNNAVIHAYKGVAPGPVEVEMNVSRDRLRVIVCDQGQSFTPDLIPEPDLDALPEGGLGLFIIRNFMDHVEYERVGDRNVLTMEKMLQSG
jgi:serine/threonine-protein kinase RsbW